MSGGLGTGSSSTYAGAGSSGIVGRGVSGGISGGGGLVRTFLDLWLFKGLLVLGVGRWVSTYSRDCEWVRSVETSIQGAVEDMIGRGSDNYADVFWEVVAGPQ